MNTHASPSLALVPSSWVLTDECVCVCVCPVRPPHCILCVYRPAVAHLATGALEGSLPRLLISPCVCVRVPVLSPLSWERASDGGVPNPVGYSAVAECTSPLREEGLSARDAVSTVPEVEEEEDDDDDDAEEEEEEEEEEELISLF